MGWMDEWMDDGAITESEDLLWDVTARFRNIRQSIMSYEALQFMETLRNWGECNQKMRGAYNEFKAATQAMGNQSNKVPDQKYMAYLQSMMMTLQQQKDQLRELSIDAKLQLEWIRKKEEYRRKQSAHLVSPEVLAALEVLNELEESIMKMTESDKKELSSSSISLRPRNPEFYEPPKLAEGMKEHAEMQHYVELYESIKKPPEDAPEALRIAYRDQAHAMNNIYHYLTPDKNGNMRKLSSWEVSDLKSSYGKVLESSVKALQRLEMEQAVTPGKYDEYVKQMKGFIKQVNEDMQALDTYKLDGTKTLEEVIRHHRAHPEEKGPDSRQYLAATLGIQDLLKEDGSLKDIPDAELDTPEGKTKFMNRQLLSYLFDYAEQKTDEHVNPPKIPTYISEDAGYLLLAMDRTAFMKSMEHKIEDPKKAERIWEGIENMKDKIQRSVVHRGLLEGEGHSAAANVEKDGTLLVKVNELGDLKIKAGEIKPVNKRTIEAKDEKRLTKTIDGMLPSTKKKVPKKEEALKKKKEKELQKVKEKEKENKLKKKAVK